MAILAKAVTLLLIGAQKKAIERQRGLVIRVQAGPESGRPALPMYTRKFAFLDLFLYRGVLAPFKLMVPFNFRGGPLWFLRGCPTYDTPLG